MLSIHLKTAKQLGMGQKPVTYLTDSPQCSERRNAIKPSITQGR